LLGSYTQGTKQSTRIIEHVGVTRMEEEQVGPQLGVRFLPDQNKRDGEKNK